MGIAAAGPGQRHAMPLVYTGTAMDLRQYLESHEALERDARFCGVDAKSRTLLHLAAGEILASAPDFATLTEIDTAIILGNEEWNAAPWRSYPRHDSAANSFMLVFPVLHHVEDIRAFYAKHGIPEHYLRELMQDLPRWIETYSDRTRGLAGFAEVAWLREHVSARMFQIGRLQFQPSTWHTPWTLLRNAQGAFALIAHGGDKVARSGQFASCLGVDASGARDIVYEERPDGIFGHRALHDGSLAFEPEFFPATEWTRHIAPGDPTLNIHIPSGSPLDPEACRASVRDATVFFKTYLPDWPIARAKAMVCGTWLLYPDFQKILPGNSNIVGFQKLFLLHPLHGMDDHQFYERAFVPEGRAVTRDKLRTRLQVALFNHIAAGNVPLEGGGVIPVQD